MREDLKPDLDGALDQIEELEQQIKEGKGAAAPSKEGTLSGTTSAESVKAPSQVQASIHSQGDTLRTLLSDLQQSVTYLTGMVENIQQQIQSSEKPTKHSGSDYWLSVDDDRRDYTKGSTVVTQE